MKQGELLLVNNYCMKLTIDTTKRDTMTLFLGDKKFETQRTEHSQSILQFLEEILQKEQKSLSDIAEIETAQGSGSFTGLRVGMSIAQTLGWLLHVPVNEKRIDKGELVQITYSS